MAERRDEQARSRPKNTWRALLWTAGSTVIPGIAHLRMGRRRTGALILTCFLLLVAAIVALAVLVSGDLIGWARLAVQGRWLLAISIAAFAISVVWMTVVIHSYVITRPLTAGWGGRTVAVVVVAALCLAVAAPAAAIMNTSYTAYDTLSSVFGDERDTLPHNEADPWNGRDRVNVLLLGGDSGSNRYGMRTDSMMVASIDVEYGDVVLIGLPRNLENVPFPEGTTLADLYPAPQGFGDLLNEVYQTVADEPEELAINPNVQDPGADTLKSVISGAIGVDVDYYMLVDMRGFQDLIDAIGGIEVEIEEPIPYGQQGDMLMPGRQRLTGNEALWYGRSRINSDDYSRMGRQGCLVKYVAQQADPTTIMTSFQRLAGATKRTLRTDIPQSKIPHFVDLADLVAEGNMKTLQLSPPQVNTAYPDWDRIKELVDDSVQEQEDAQGGGQERTPGTGDLDQAAPSPGTTEETEWQTYTGLPDPAPTTPGRQVGEEATSLDTLCP
ncbi:LCP family protein [Nocardiopsis ansamitocini]|uniref:Cell envelope-related transcriptional attenuator domain-containing protein n=1 Tax=Nocardiopsis ansamitocini TaxID=1670832 RepID=A0A9W6P234_9ACTN|nr:LCP family protein [Nocardiopsis ansamitocini]GLU45825.1 hypothetical protein Nans01_01760 [Nocardiopsis ansamitocini]